VATFLGKKITPQLAQEIGSRFATRTEGTCIKHRLGKASVKMYDKFGRVLRLETTTNDVSFSNTTARWNVETIPVTESSQPSKSQSTVSLTCVKSSWDAIDATLITSLYWMTSHQATKS